MDREQFLSQFETVRADFFDRGTDWKVTVGYLRDKLYAAVRNMDWVNLFSWVLPSADKEHSIENRATGRMVTAIFYIELLSKYGQDYENDILKKIEARWRLVNEQ